MFECVNCDFKHKKTRQFRKFGDSNICLKCYTLMNRIIKSQSVGENSEATNNRTDSHNDGEDDCHGDRVIVDSEDKIEAEIPEDGVEAEVPESGVGAEIPEDVMENKVMEDESSNDHLPLDEVHPPLMKVKLSFGRFKQSTSR
ncbi:hypothetical protein QAD02_002178 [Eretmocerus hayati]|uniref:Uncharacterized protein n=1 Tax=Eretmocerus hayati TaxID=131215 RepID=A0ACC2NIG4_9HYME|nr:hypothetical protein QAD02_002178 [Eretmocerus hayati]